MLMLRLLAVFGLVAFANALHFYLDANEKRCFIEELPTDTVVEGKGHISRLACHSYLHSRAGHYRALEWSDSSQAYVENSELGILVDVAVRPPILPTL